MVQVGTDNGNGTDGTKNMSSLSDWAKALSGRLYLYPATYVGIIFHGWLLSSSNLILQRQPRWLQGWSLVPFSHSHDMRSIGSLGGAFAAQLPKRTSMKLLSAQV